MSFKEWGGLISSDIIPHKGTRFYSPLRSHGQIRLSRSGFLTSTKLTAKLNLLKLLLAYLLHCHKFCVGLKTNNNKYILSACIPSKALVTCKTEWLIHDKYVLVCICYTTIEIVHTLCKSTRKPTTLMLYHSIHLLSPLMNDHMHNESPRMLNSPVNSKLFTNGLSALICVVGFK